MSQTLLQLQDVRFRYDTSGPEVLAGIDLTLKRGQSLAVVGQSGCGKSTLLNIIGTLESPTSGRVALDGLDYSTLDPRQVAGLRSRKIGFIFQDHHLLPQCTLLENVLVPTLPLGRSAASSSRERAEKLLSRVGLSEQTHKRPGEVSGGQRQRCAVVRALINQPMLLLADEPTGALDRASAESLGQLLLEINREQNLALVVVTHSMPLAGLMHAAAELRDGRLSPLTPGAAPL